MKGKAFLMLLIALLGSMTKAQAQDQVRVYLPFEARVGNTILPPSEYLIRQVSGTILQFVRNPRDPATVEVEAMVMTIPTTNNKVSEETKVVLHRFGNSHYIDKIWVQGKGSGYEFVLPESLRSLERERTFVSVYYDPAWSED